MIRKDQKIKTQISRTDVKEISYYEAVEPFSNSIDKEELTSTIYFYRLPNFTGRAIKMKLLVNDFPIVMLANNSVYQLNIKPGVYRFSCKMADSTVLKLTIESGKAYYIKCSMNQGFWSGFPVMEMVDPISGGAVISGGSLSRQEYVPLSMIRPNTRLGLFIGGGAGFETIPMGYTEKGDELTLSTGGGFSIGAEYGYELNKNFDLSVNWFYQGSTLSQRISNGDASYNRMGIIVTPAVIIPVKGGDYFRFKLGGGLGYYGLGTMTVNGSDSGGQDFTLKYEPAIGFHLSLIFESYFSEKGSFTLGLKYSKIQYNYTKTGSTATSNDPKILNPDGSGIDFVMGYYYHF